MAAHTPGPWMANYGTILDAKCRRVAAVIGAFDLPEPKANTLLMAAAPELLEALRNLMAAYSEPDDRICCNGSMCGCRGATKRDMAEHYAKEAIAKATGEHL